MNEFIKASCVCDITWLDLSFQADPPIRARKIVQTKQTGADVFLSQLLINWTSLNVELDIGKKKANYIMGLTPGPS